MENVRNRINFRLLKTEEKASNIRNSRIKYTIFNENLFSWYSFMLTRSSSKKQYLLLNECQMIQLY